MDETEKRNYKYMFGMKIESHPSIIIHRTEFFQNFFYQTLENMFYTQMHTIHDICYEKRKTFQIKCSKIF